MSNLKKKQRGFTIVELAIVVMIIGLATGAVIMGARMITNSRLVATYMQVQTVSTSLKAFTDKYRAMPGDMPNATTRLSNCDNIPAGSCTNGNGNNVIGPVDQPIFVDQAGAAYDENRLFWYHLTSADLIIHEINIHAPVSTPTWGLTNPAAPADGGFNVISMTGSTNDMPNDFLSGVYIVWQMTPTGDASAAENTIVTPRDAEYLDQKFDDGRPLTGTIRGRGGNSALGADNCRANATDYLGADNLGCYMYFKIREVSGL